MTTQLTLLAKPQRSIFTSPDPPACLPTPADIQIGDWVIFADGVTHRVADRYNWIQGVKRISTTLFGSFYVSQTQRCFTGDQHQSIEASNLIPTYELRLGQCWRCKIDAGVKVAKLHFGATRRLKFPLLRDSEKFRNIEPVCS